MITLPNGGEYNPSITDYSQQPSDVTDFVDGLDLKGPTRLFGDNYRKKQVWSGYFEMDGVNYFVHIYESVIDNTVYEKDLVIV